MKSVRLDDNLQAKLKRAARDILDVPLDVPITPPMFY